MALQDITDGHAWPSKAPIGREELSQLLDSFPDVHPTDFTQMSAERLRRALGL